MNWNFLRYKIHQNWNGIEKHGEENIMELEELKKIGNSIGFFKVEELNIDKIKLLPEVRQMCSTDKCHMYGRNWSCPPACGTLEECAADISGYKKGIIVQTKGELEDEFDGEGMMETEALHKEHFVKMHDQLKKFFPKLLSLGAGCCTRCAKCSYPDAPCRHPDKMFPCVESYGILVTNMAEQCGIEFIEGGNVVVWFSLVLLRERPQS